LATGRRDICLRVLSYRQGMPIEAHGLPKKLGPLQRFTACECLARRAWVNGYTPAWKYQLI
jgi:hypothetical protein